MSRLVDKTPRALSGTGFITHSDTVCAFDSQGPKSVFWKKRKKDEKEETIN
jgi:hypothetical protein